MTRHTNNGGREVAAHARVLLPVLVLMMTSVLRADEMVTHWSKVMLATSSRAGTDPITSTRTAAIVQTAVFDLLNGIEKKYKPIHADFRWPDEASEFAGIHYRTSCLNGNKLGSAVAHFVMDHSMKPRSQEGGHD